jgi:hypothetical protein
MRTVATEGIASDVPHIPGPLFLIAIQIHPLHPSTTELGPQILHYTNGTPGVSAWPKRRAYEGRALARVLCGRATHGRLAPASPSAQGNEAEFYRRHCSHRCYPPNTRHKQSLARLRVDRPGASVQDAASLASRRLYRGMDMRSSYRVGCKLLIVGVGTTYDLLTWCSIGSPTHAGRGARRPRACR